MSTLKFAPRDQAELVRTDRRVAEHHMKRGIAAFLLAVCASSISLAQHGSDQESRQPTRTKIPIEDRLRQLVEVEDATTFIDVGAMSYVPEWPSRLGVEGMKLLAAELRRDWKQVDGIQVFLRPRGPETLTGYRSFKAAGIFLESLSGSQIKSLLSGELLASDLPKDIVSQLLLETTGITLGAKFRLLEDQPNVRLGMVADSELTVKDRDGRIVKTVIQRPNPPRKFGKPELKPVEVVPLDAPVGGDLDFGEGRLLTLVELLVKAKETFGADYYYDQRLAETQFFLSGTFGKEQFDRVLAMHTDIPPVQPMSEQYDRVVTQLWDALESRFLDGLAESQGVESAESQFQGRTISMKEVASDFPEAYARFKAQGLSDSDQVTVRLRFRIFADPGTSTIIGGGVRAGTGEQFTVTTQDLSYIWLPSKTRN